MLVATVCEVGITSSKGWASVVILVMMLVGVIMTIAISEATCKGRTTSGSAITTLVLREAMHGDMM